MTNKKNKIRRRNFIKDSAVATIAMTLSPMAFAQRTVQKRPNIVFILTDQWRASAIGYTGDPNVKTPHLDSLAKESLNFKNAISVCPVCTPYRASLLTGRYPTSTGMFLNDANLPEGELCIAEVLQNSGYKTGYIGKWHLDGHGRKDYIPPERRQGFDYWKTAECDHNYNHSHYYSGLSEEMRFWDGYDVFAQTKDANQYLREQAKADHPFALFVSYGTPHFPHHTAPEEYKKKYPIEKIKLPANVPPEMEDLARKEAQGYYAHCEALDDSIGELLAEIDKTGIKEETIVVFTSDHGEMLGSHGVRPMEKQVPWAESARVPFLIRFPSTLDNQGHVFNLPLNTPDIFPTLLGLTGITIPHSIEGDDLSEIMKKGEDDENHSALYMAVAPFNRFAELRKEYRAVKTGQYTYVRGIDGPWLLYDDLKDPFQMENLVNKPEYSALLKDMDERLSSLLEKVGDDFRPAASYIAEWGFDVDPERGHIPYKDHDQKPQTPMRILKNRR
jgi:arylsulfatase A-like enzyme